MKEKIIEDILGIIFGVVFGIMFTLSIVIVLAFSENDTLDAMNKKLVLEKALKLACEDVKYYEQMRDREYGFFDYDIDYDIRAMVENYIQQARESLKNDN